MVVVPIGYDDAKVFLQYVLGLRTAHCSDTIGLTLVYPQLQPFRKPS